MALPFGNHQPFEHFARLLIGPEQTMIVIAKQIYQLLTRPTQESLGRLIALAAMFNGNSVDKIFYTAEDKRGGTMLCATISDLTPQLNCTSVYKDKAGPVISKTKPPNLKKLLLKGTDQAIHC